MKFKRTSSAAAAALAAAVVCAPAYADTNVKQLGSPTTLRLAGVGPNDPPAEALVASQGADLLVKLRLRSASEKPSVAYIQRGRCADRSHSRAYSLTPVLNGQSSSKLKHVSVTQLHAHPYSLVIARPGTPQAPMECGDV